MLVALLLFLNLFQTIRASCNSDQLQLYLEGTAKITHGKCLAIDPMMTCEKHGCLFWGTNKSAEELEEEQSAFGTETSACNNLGWASRCQCCFLTRGQQYHVIAQKLETQVASRDRKVSKLKMQISKDDREKEQIARIAEKLQTQIVGESNQISKLKTLIGLILVSLMIILTMGFALVKVCKKKQFSSWPFAKLREPLIDTSEVASVIEHKDKEIETLKEKILAVEKDFQMELGGMIKLEGGRLGKLGSDFDFLIYDDGNEVETNRIIKIQCSGVSHGKIGCEMIFNGCIVTIQREATIAITEATWTKKFQFMLSDGLFELLPERMELEQGIFTIVFRRSTFTGGQVRFAERYCMSLSDYEQTWMIPSNGGAGGVAMSMPSGTASGVVMSIPPGAPVSNADDNAESIAGSARDMAMSIPPGARVSNAGSVASGVSMPSWIKVPSKATSDVSSEP